MELAKLLLSDRPFGVHCLSCRAAIGRLLRVPASWGQTKAARWRRVIECRPFGAAEFHLGGRRGSPELRSVFPAEFGPSLSDTFACVAAAPRQQHSAARLRGANAEVHTNAAPHAHILPHMHKCSPAAPSYRHSSAEWPTFRALGLWFHLISFYLSSARRAANLFTHAALF